MSTETIRDVRAVLDAYFDGINGERYEDVAALFAADGELVAPGVRPRIGRDELRPGEGERVVVVGGSATGCETAEHLIGLGIGVTIFEMRKGVGFGIEAINAGADAGLAL